MDYDTRQEILSKESLVGLKNLEEWQIGTISWTQPSYPLLPALNYFDNTA